MPRVPTRAALRTALHTFAAAAAFPTHCTPSRHTASSPPALYRTKRFAPTFPAPISRSGSVLVHLPFTFTPPLTPLYFMPQNFNITCLQILPYTHGRTTALPLLFHPPRARHTPCPHHPTHTTADTDCRRPTPLPHFSRYHTAPHRAFGQQPISAIVVDVLTHIQATFARR